MKNTFVLLHCLLISIAGYAKSSDLNLDYAIEANFLYSSEANLDSLNLATNTINNQSESQTGNRTLAPNKPGIK